jgi:hypothetical protein
MGPGPVASPSPNPGKEAGSIAEVRQAVSILQKSFAGLDPGSPLGEAVLKAIQGLSKHAPAQQGAPGVGNAALANLVKQAMSSAPMASVQRSMAGAPAPAAPPSTPPPGV